MYKKLESLYLRCPRAWASDNSLKILQLIFLLSSTELEQVNVILIGQLEAETLMKNLKPIWNYIQSQLKQYPIL